MEDSFNSITPDDWKRSLARSRSETNPLTQQMRDAVAKDCEIPPGLSGKVAVSASTINGLRDTLISTLGLYLSAHSVVNCQTYSPGDGPSVVFVLSMQESDFRKAVGKGGRNYKALALLMSEIGASLNIEINVKIKPPVWGQNVNGPLTPLYYDADEVLRVVKLLITNLTGADHLVRHTWIDESTDHFSCILKFPISHEAQEAITHILSLCGSKFKRKIYINFS